MTHGPGGAQRTASLCLAPDGCAGSWGARVRTTLERGGWTPGTGSAPVAVLVAPDLTAHPCEVLVADARGRSRSGAVVLVTAGTVANLCALGRFTVEAVVTDLEIEGMLVRRLEEVVPASLCEELRAAARRGKLDPLVREVVETAATASPPVRTRKRLLRQLSCNSPATLWAHWRQAPPCLGQPSDFLRRVALLHFVDLRRAGTDRKAALAALGLSRASIHDWARRFFDTTPAALVREGSAADRWTREVAEALQWGRVEQNRTDSEHLTD